MFPIRLFAPTGNILVRLESVDCASVETVIVLGNKHRSGEGHIVNDVTCLAVGPHNSRRIFVGAFDGGINHTH